MHPITVLGIGNILMQDEGFGIQIIETLCKRYRFPEQVQVLDGGTLGMELLRFISGSTQLIVIDAIAGNGLPGTFYQFTGNEINRYLQGKVSLHELGIKDVLFSLEVLNNPVAEVVILGVQPAVVDLGLGLTPPVAAKIEQTVTAVIDQLKSWQVEATQNS
jgi:hydrogenase maturation protease